MNKFRGALNNIGIIYIISLNGLCNIIFLIKIISVGLISLLMLRMILEEGRSRLNDYINWLKNIQQRHQCDDINNMIIYIFNNNLYISYIHFL